MALIRVFIGSCDVIGMEFCKGSRLVTLGPGGDVFYPTHTHKGKNDVCVCVCVHVSVRLSVHHFSR